MTKKQKKMLLRIIVAASLFFLAIVLKNNFYLSLCLYILSYLILAYDLLYKAIRNIFKGLVFDENFLMALASLGAFALGEYSEAVAVMLFYQIGEWFQDYAVNRSRKSIAELMDIRPDYANIEKDGKLIAVDPDEVEIGDIIIIQPGEKVPLDGLVIEGESNLDTSSLTGESLPRKVKVGEEVISGCINSNGLLKVEVSKEFSESTVVKILDLVENASEKKSKSEAFISKFAKYYTPIVVISALLLAILPPLFLGFKDINVWKTWIYRALTFLVISCPCALVLSVPLGFFGGIGGAGKQGILIKGGNYLEALTQVKTIAVDKTGTLTEGKFKVREVNSFNGFSQEDVLSKAALAESYSKHPIALALKEAINVEEKQLSDYQELAGRGVSVKIDKQRVLVGNSLLMQENNIDFVAENKQCIYVAIDDKYAGYIVLGDEIKKESKAAIKQLKDLGIEKIVMLSGDSEEVAGAVTAELNIDEYRAQLLPEDKVSEVESLLNEKNKLAFVGDGVNDAPVLTRADIGIAMGALGSDAAIEAADIVLMDDDLSKVAKAIRIAKKTNRIVKENIYFALSVKIITLILASLGLANMWAAVFADVGVAFICVLNSMRCLDMKNV